MTCSNGNTGQSSEVLVVVRVADELNHALSGRVGCCYESPPQPHEQALALVEVLLGYGRGSLDGADRWSCPIAGGRRVVTIGEVPVRCSA